MIYLFNKYESLEDIQHRDNLKNQWAFKHRYTLIRILYTHYNDLCIEDLSLEHLNLL